MFFHYLLWRLCTLVYWGNATIGKCLYKNRDLKVSPKTSIEKWAYDLCKSPKYEIILYFIWMSQRCRTRLWGTGCRLGLLGQCSGLFQEISQLSDMKIQIRLSNQRFVLLPLFLGIWDYCKIIFLLRFQLLLSSWWQVPAFFSGLCSDLRKLLKRKNIKIGIPGFLLFIWSSYCRIFARKLMITKYS